MTGLLVWVYHTGRWSIDKGTPVQSRNARRLGQVACMICLWSATGNMDGKASGRPSIRRDRLVSILCSAKPSPLSEPATGASGAALSGRWPILCERI